MKSHLKIAITPENIFENESKYLTILAENGWDMIHLRHPGATLNEVKKLIETIPQRYHRKIKLHGHFDLVYEFNLGGLHLNHRCPEPPINWKGGLSCSMHSISEIESYESRYDYVTLSPIFDSISKKGYKGAIDLNEFAEKKKELNVRVVALGGVNYEHVDELLRRGFDGYAVLGAIFEDISDEESFRRRIEKFK